MAKLILNSSLHLTNEKLEIQLVAAADSFLENTILLNR